MEFIEFMLVYPEEFKIKVKVELWASGQLWEPHQPELMIFHLETYHYYVFSFYFPDTVSLNLDLKKMSFDQLSTLIQS